jgi:hypothetical protein
MKSSPHGSASRIAAAAIALLTWYALVLQFYVSIQTARATGASMATTIANFFSFFTILTNLLVALVLTLSLRKAPSGLSAFAARSSVQTATAVYIVVVGIVYSIALRSLWAPEGLQKIADFTLHDAIPVLYLFYWLLFVRKDGLRFSQVSVWQVYPFVYLVYSLIRGSLTGIYLYPFLDAGQFGYAHVGRSALVIFAAFLALSLLFVVLGRWMPRPSE